MHLTRKQSGLFPSSAPLSPISQIASLNFKIPLSHLKYNFPLDLTKERVRMLDHIILTLSDVERSLKFYVAALKPLKIKMSEPYKGADRHPDLWGLVTAKRHFSG